MLTIDGSQGEGGGQIVRTSLSLSLLSGTPVRIEKLRAGRSKPGLLRQHLTAVNAAAQIGDAAVSGAEIGSQTIEFRPRTIRPGDYTFSIGSAGSTTLVLQTVLPALWAADGPSQLTLEGGTHNPLAPTFDFIVRAFLPLLARMGVQVQATLDRPGFFPAGGGRMRVTVQPAGKLAAISILERGAVRARRATAMWTSLPSDVARRELATAQARLGLSDADCAARPIRGAHGPANVFQIEVESEHVTEVFTAFGERGLAAERVAEQACEEAEAYLNSQAAVGPHLADQLLLPMAMAGEGAFSSLAATPHTETQMAILARFLGTRVGRRQVSADTWHFHVSAG